MEARQLDPAAVSHQARLVLALADRKGWNGLQRLFVAAVLVVGVWHSLRRRKPRAFFYAHEDADHRLQLETQKAKLRSGEFLCR